MSRDPCRTPMQWTPGPNAGFSPRETKELWLPLANDCQHVNVERELADPRSILNLYRCLLSYRDSSSALKWGSYQPLDSVPEACFAYLREADEERVLVVINFSAEKQTISLPDLGHGGVAVSTHMDRPGPVDLGHLTLRPNEGLIIEV
jgi:alpha-glucosidase